MAPTHPPITATGRHQPQSAWLIPAYAILFGVLCLVVNLYTNFLQSHNDFWDNVFIARNLSLDDPNSWYSPFFPIAYNLIVKCFPASIFPSIPATIINIVCAVLLLWTSGILFRRFLPHSWALALVVVMSLFPRIIRYVCTGGPDPVAILLLIAGVTILILDLHDDKTRPRWGRFMVAGLLIGLGALCRYHILVCGVLSIGCLGLVYRRAWMMLLVTLAGVCLAYSPQVAVNLITGHGVLETNYSIVNIYNLMYPLTWHEIGTLVLPSSALELVLSDPLSFARGYGTNLARFSPIIIPPIIAVLLCRGPIRRMCVAILLWVVGYSFFSAISISPRGILPCLPFAFLCAGLAMQRLVNLVVTVVRAPVVRVGAGAFAIAVAGVFAIRDVRLVAEWGREKKVLADVDAFLRSQGIESVRQVFTCDYNFYIRSLPPYIPYFNGGGPRLGTYEYDKEYPQFAAETPEAFVADCRMRGVKFAVLTEEARFDSEGLGRLYDDSGRFGIPVVREIGRFRVLEVGSAGE